MDDRELEERLRQFTPTGPAPELRARSLTMPARGSGRAWPWAAAAAALLVATLGLHTAGGQVRARLDIAPRIGDAALEIANLTDRLGGGAEAREVAELIVAQEAIRRAVDRNVTDPATPSENR